MTLNFSKLTLATAIIAVAAGASHAQVFSSSTSYDNATSPSQSVMSPPPVHTNVVTPGDTFSFAISGYNTAGTTGYLLTPRETATFGATTTFTGVGINSQDITVTSSETVTGTSTTDTFTVTTPANFLTTTTVSGTTISQLYLDLGDGNSGSNTVDLALPVVTGSQTSSAYILYGTSNTQYSYTPANPTLSNSNLSYAEQEGVSVGTSAISSLAVHQFTFTTTYSSIVSAAAPEPSAVALSLSGALLMVGGIVRRRRAHA